MILLSSHIYFIAMKNHIQKIVLPVILFIGLFGLYFSMLPDRLTGSNFAGDSGDFLAAVLTRGVPHPTGYPTYLMLSAFAVAIPFGTPYFRLALLSAISASLASMLFMLWMQKFILENHKFSKWIAFITAVTFGTIPLFWSQAVIVEVYALNSLFFLGVIWWIGLLITTTNSNLKLFLWCALALEGGLACGMHATILLMFPVLILAFIDFGCRGQSWKIIILQIGFFMTGMLIYLILPVRAFNYPPINWGNAQNLDGFLWMISGKPYQGLLTAVSPGTTLKNTANLMRVFLDQLSLPVFTLGLAGSILGTFKILRIKWLILWLTCVYFLFTLNYHTEDVIVYLIPAFTGFLCWVAVLLSKFVDFNWHAIKAGQITLVLFSVYIFARPIFFYSEIDPRKDYSPATFAESYLDYVPAGAILIAQSDEDIFPLWYYHFGLGYRPDVRVIALPLTQFRWYQETFQKTYPDITVPSFVDSQNANWGREIPGLNQTRPVCTSESDIINSGRIKFHCQQGQ
jgi:hypothetical protein